MSAPDRLKCDVFRTSTSLKSANLSDAEELEVLAGLLEFLRTELGVIGILEAIGRAVAPIG